MDVTRKRTYVFVFFSCSCLIMFLFIYGDKRIGYTVYTLFQRNDFSSHIYDYNTTVGCQMPSWDPFHPSVKKYYQKLVVPYKCGGRPSFLVIKSNATVVVNESILWKHHSLRKEDMSCKYEEIARDSGTVSDPTDNKIKYLNPRKITFGVPLGIEFLRVQCLVNGKKINDEYLALTPLKPLIEKEANERTVHSHFKEKLNVIILGVDSISRLNFVRHFHKTRQFLRDNLKAIELTRYNKVADNTFPNLTPFLTGHFVKDYAKDKFYDEIDLIWKHFSKVGYRTLLAEDAPKIATYNYLKKGFKNPPADYYLRPFNLAVEKSDVRKKSKLHCFGDKMEMKVIFDYLRSFVETMGDRPHFSFTFVARLTHDKLNNAAYADQPVYEILHHLKETNVTENSLIVFMSDHGIRFGKIRETYIGKFEERWPLMHLSFPEWFLKKYPDIANTLKSNQHKLTTPFDVHKTFLDVLQIVTSGSYSGITDSTMPNGISLFQNIPIQRTCEEAGILPHWCTCQMQVPVSVKSKEVRKAADALVNALNSYVTNLPSGCATLSLNNIKDAYFSTKDNSSSSPLDYLLTISVDPNNAVFEGTVRYHQKKFEVQGDISRINHYGNEGDCVDDFRLRKFCYCK